MKNEINLLPIQPRKKRMVYFSKRKMWSGVVFGACILLLVVYVSLSLMDQICKNKIAQAEEVIKNKNATQIINTNITEQNNILDYRYRLTELIAENKDLLLKSLTGIHEVLPSGVNLLEYTYQDGLLNISGEAKNQEVILEFREKLLGLDLFKTVNLIDTNKKVRTDIEKKSQINENLNDDLWEFKFEIQLLEVEKT